MKVGSSLLVDAAAGPLKRDWLASLAADIAGLHKEKRDVIVVSSGAIALGRAVLKLPAGALKLEDSQAAAAVGQIALARAWSERLSAHALTAGQVLVTLGDTEERRRYLNARSTIAKLLEWRSVPVINENDTVATSEIRYGDNDRLAARVATMMSADLLVLLSDVDGLYDKPPGKRGAKLVPLVARITPEIEAMAGVSASEHARGGMLTKIEAGKIATTAGTHMIIASGHVRASAAGASPTARACTWFLTPANPVTARKKWIAGSLEPRGALMIDAGAVKALRSGKSLLPAGVVQDRGRVRARRRRGGARAGRRRDRPRADRLRRGGRRADQGPLLGGYPRDPRLRRADRDDPPRRSCSGRRIVRRRSSLRAELQQRRSARCCGDPATRRPARPSILADPATVAVGSAIGRPRPPALIRRGLLASASGRVSAGGVRGLPERRLAPDLRCTGWVGSGKNVPSGNSRYRLKTCTSSPVGLRRCAGLRSRTWCRPESGWAADLN